MMTSEPLPFRLALPDDDHWGFTGIEHTAYTITGLLHLSEDALFLEWAERRKVERFTWTRIGTDHEEFPVETLEIPLDWIASLEVIGGWWMPRVRLRARRLDTFEGVPGAEPGRLVLVIARRDRALAAALPGRVVELIGEYVGRGGAGATRQPIHTPIR